ncbi:MAG TPA: glycosyltransferase [Candidatus Babeliales bacterium]|nr:glycosyltransferase [Candidatus Babeliales bacterium]
MKVAIVVPAYNEEKRIGRMLDHYVEYFTGLHIAKIVDFEFIVVLNGCVDNTHGVVEAVQKRCDKVRMITSESAGKGHAIATGFADALLRDNDLIGFVDADMATRPEYFYALIREIYDCDGVIASRHMPESVVTPARPWIKRWGKRIFYDGLAYLLFGLAYYDMQCGAKLFKRHVITTVVPHLTVKQWAFDVELLYLCKKNGFLIKEIPTVWHDQADSKLTNIFCAGFPMLASLFRVKFRHLFS